MAHKIVEPLGAPGTPATRYPWDAWLDGDVWELVPGEDFTCTTGSFRASVHEAARRRMIRAQTRERDGKFYVQAIQVVNGE